MRSESYCDVCTDTIYGVLILRYYLDMQYGVASYMNIVRFFIYAIFFKTAL